MPAISQNLLWCPLLPESSGYRPRHIFTINVIIFVGNVIKWLKRETMSKRKHHQRDKYKHKRMQNDFEETEWLQKDKSNYNETQNDGKRHIKNTNTKWPWGDTNQLATDIEETAKRHKMTTKTHKVFCWDEIVWSHFTVTSDFRL